MALALTNDFADGDALDADKVQTNFEEIEAKFGAIGSTDLAADAVTGAKLADDAVDTEHIADDAIVAAAIDDDAVGTAAIADDALDSQHYAASSIDWEHQADETPNVFYKTFTGTGAALNITGCPFTPTLATVLPMEAVSGVTIIVKHTSMAGSNSIRLTDGGILTTAITALNADGISVGAAMLISKSFLAIMQRSKT